MHGSGMWLINPPYLLVEQLRHTLPILVERLQQDDGVRYILNYQLK